jgi:NADH-quinone oxidoreductase subunit E
MTETAEHLVRHAAARALDMASAHLQGMNLLMIKTVLLLAVAFFIPALLAYALTPVRRRPRRATPAPMLLEDEPAPVDPFAALPEAPPQAEATPPQPAARPAQVSYLDAAAEAFTAGVLARPAPGFRLDRGPYAPLPPGRVHDAPSDAEAGPEAVTDTVVVHPQAANLQRRVSSLAAMTPVSVLAAVEQAGSGLEPVRLSAPQGAADDLSVLSGVTPAAEAELNALGIWHYWQVAGWGPEEVAWINSRIHPGDRIARENWMAQAAKLIRI